MKIKKMKEFKTITQFLSALSRAYDYVEGCCYARTYVRLKEQDQDSLEQN